MGSSERCLFAINFVLTRLRVPFVMFAKDEELIQVKTLMEQPNVDLEESL